MDWVKLSTKYYFDPAIAALDDDAPEVMFDRGLAYCGLAETGGFIPDSIVPTLTRKPARAHKIADQLVHAGPWLRVTGGYRIVRWHEWQHDLEELLQRRKSDRERKRRQRSRDRDLSRDRHVTVTPQREEGEEEDAAAAASRDPSRSSGRGVELPAPLDILRAKMARNTALAGVRWDKLDHAQTLAIEDLIGTHGDHVLVDVALRTCRNPPPVLVNAFLGTWLALPDPGQKLRLVDEPHCPETGHEYELARCCRLCAAERHAGERP